MRKRLFCGFVACVMFNGPLCGAADDKGRPTFNEALKAVLSADNVGDLWYEHRELREIASPAQMRGLMFHEDNSTAVWAAWNVLLESSREKTAKIHAESEELDPLLEGDWFLGFIEGRAKFPIPPAWRDTFRSMRVDSRHNVAADTTPMLRLFQQDKRYIPVLKPQTLELRAEGTVVIVDGDPVPIPQEFVKNGVLTSGICIAQTTESYLLAFPKVISFEYALLCINRKTRQITWRTKVWASAGGASSGIPAPHVAIPVVHKSHVYVFGAAGGLMYVEGFQLTDGANVFRFSVGY